MFHPDLSAVRTYLFLPSSVALFAAVSEIVVASAVYAAFSPLLNVKGRGGRRGGPPREERGVLLGGAGTPGLERKHRLGGHDRAQPPGRTWGENGGGGANCRRHCCWNGRAGIACRGAVKPVFFSDAVREMCWAHFKLVLRVQTMTGAVN